MEQTSVWVFQGDGQNVVSGCFATQKAAEAWIAQKRLSGVLTAYPLNQPIYDWAMEQGYWQPTQTHHSQARFIQNLPARICHIFIILMACAKMDNAQLAA